MADATEAAQRTAAQLRESYAQREPFELYLPGRYLPRHDEVAAALRRLFPGQVSYVVYSCEPDEVRKRVLPDG